MSNRFENLISRLPVSWETLLGSGISYFIKEQDPEHSRFVVHKDDDEVIGWSIRVDTGKENVREAKEFWEDYIEPELRGE